jgi:hypothetical protein
LLCGHRCQKRAGFVVDGAPRHEDVGERPAAFAVPGREGGNEMVLIDQAILEGQQAKEEVLRVWSAPAIVNAPGPAS